MTAKEYLMQYRIISSRIRAIEGMILALREELEGLGAGSLRSAWPDGQPHGTGTTDPTGNQAIKAAETISEEYREKLRRRLMDLEVREYKARSELWRQRIEIEETLGAVTDPTHHDILHMHYIEGKTFEWIAVEIGYSFRHTIRLHGEALKAIDRIRERKEK